MPRPLDIGASRARPCKVIEALMSKTLIVFVALVAIAVVTGVLAVVSYLRERKTSADG